VIGLQETKVHDDQFPLDEVRALGYHVYFHGQKAMASPLLSRKEPLSVHKGFASDERRPAPLYLGHFRRRQWRPVTIMNGYFPQGESRDHPTKFPAKQRFYSDLQHLLESQFSNDQPWW
jgi:exodeoxyribonuclease-3